VDYFTSNDSNVNVAVLDLSKAFHKINHNNLFYKLVKRGIPTCVVNILLNWFSVTTTSVMWNGFMSVAVSLQFGVRQGGILSPHLFAAYVDDLFEILEASGMGCYANGFCVNSPMYADDLIVLALTLYDLRHLLKLCSEFFASLDMPLNISKRKCSRFGLRYKSNVLI